MNAPITLKIHKIVDEAKGIKTFIFKHKLNAKPGQFIMLWLPEINEKPFSISYEDKEKFAVTVAKVGDFTKELFALKENDSVGIRGPYGSHFSIKKGKIVLIGGGYGTAPLAFLADKINSNVTFIIGAKSKEYLIYLNRIKVNKLISTDNGSYGIKGTTIDLLKRFISKNKVNFIYACGPEAMLKKIIDIANENNINCEVLIERYMKCGFGICGNCCIDNLGIRMCVEGPVVNRDTANKLFEFNKYKRTSSGKRINLG